MKRTSKFLGGRHGTTYTCDCCGKRTRETGDGESNLGLCAKCYDEAGWENSHSDGGHEPGTHPDECPTCREYLAEQAAEPEAEYFGPVDPDGCGDHNAPTDHCEMDAPTGHDTTEALWVGPPPFNTAFVLAVSVEGAGYWYGPFDQGTGWSAAEGQASRMRAQPHMWAEVRVVPLDAAWVVGALGQRKGG